MPEPLVFVVNEAVRLMLIPTGGFGWVAEGNAVADAGTSECLLGISAADPAAVDAIVDRAQQAGATVRLAPGEQSWGYAATFADPDDHLWTVTAGQLGG